MWRYRNQVPTLIIGIVILLNITDAQKCTPENVCEKQVYIMKTKKLKMCPDGFTCSKDGSVPFYVKFSTHDNIIDPKLGKTLFIIDNATNRVYSPPWPDPADSEPCEPVSFSLKRIKKPVKDESNCFVCVWSLNGTSKLMLSFHSDGIKYAYYEGSLDEAIERDRDAMHKFCFHKAYENEQRKSYDWQPPQCTTALQLSSTTALTKFTSIETTRSAASTIKYGPSTTKLKSIGNERITTAVIRRTSKITKEMQRRYETRNEQKSTTFATKKVEAITYRNDSHLTTKACSLGLSYMQFDYNHEYPSCEKLLKQTNKLPSRGIQQFFSAADFDKILSFKILPQCEKSASVKWKPRSLLEEIYHVHQNCSPMGEWPQTIAKVAHALGEVWLISCSSFSMIVMFIARETSFERKIHMFQELLLLLSHLTVVFMAQRTDLAEICYSAAILLQYSFLCLALLLLLEIVQCHFIMTNLIWRGSAIGGRIAAALILFIPLALVVGTKFGLKIQQISTYSCWLNYGSQAASFATTIPLLIVVSVGFVLLEDAQMRHLSPMFMANKRQRKMAPVSLYSMWIKLPLHIASFLLTSLTIYLQDFSFFTLTFAVNVSLGVSIIVFHVGASEKATQLWIRLGNICSKKEAKKQ